VTQTGSKNTLLWGVPIVALALILRVALVYISWGSNDATIWEKLGWEIANVGLLKTYPIDRDFNHPPLPGCWAGIAYRLTHERGSAPAPPNERKPGLTFPFVFKQINLLADVVVCWLLWKILRPRFGSTVAAGAAVLYAWSLDSILMTAHHCNTDPVYAMFCLLAVYLIEDRRRDFWGGVALAAGINVKLIPILLILPLLLSYHERRRAIRFLGGVSIGVIPFIPVLLFQGEAYYHNALTYGSTATNWGINYFLLETSREPLIAQYYKIGRAIVIAAILLLSLRARRDPGVNRYTLCACSAALFLILTPGFGYQYMILAVPLLFATGRLLPATLFGLFGGLVLFFTYWQNWHGGLPIDSYTLIGPAAPGPLYGLLAWATLIVFVYTELRRRQR
jgi:hypothetical protein